MKHLAAALELYRTENALYPIATGFASEPPGPPGVVYAHHKPRHTRGGHILMDRHVEVCCSAAPLMKFLTQALGCPGRYRTTWLFYPRKLQKAPANPIPARTASASCSVFRRQSGLSLSAYQARASSQHCSGNIVAPRGRSRNVHHRSMCSSDRKRSMVDQVKPMLSHHRAAGTPKCTMPSDRVSVPFLTSRSIWASQSPQRMVSVASASRAAGMPRASQMQIPQ